MHLGSPRLEVGTTSARLSCDVHHSGEMHTWWIATDHDDIGVIDLGPGAFVPVALSLASSLGEDLAIEAPISAQQLHGCRAAAHVLHRQWGWRQPVVSASTERQPFVAGPDVGLLFTRGIDSMATLVASLDGVGPRVTRLIVIDGLEPNHSADVAAAVWHDTQAVAGAVGLPIHRLTTNVRDEIERYIPWKYSHGAVLLGSALALGPLFDEIVISSSNSVRYPRANGSAPDLDACWSTDRTTITHWGVSMSRSDKAALVATRPQLAAQLKVCWESNRRGNCGTCSKCLLAMTAFTVAGAHSVVEAAFDGPLSCEAIRRLGPVPSFVREEVIEAIGDDQSDLRDAWRDCLSRERNHQRRGLAGLDPAERFAAVGMTLQPDEAVGWGGAARAIYAGSANRQAVCDAFAHLDRPLRWCLAARATPGSAQMATVLTQHWGHGGVMLTDDVTPGPPPAAVGRLLQQADVRCWWSDHDHLDGICLLEAIEHGCVPVQVMPDDLAETLRAALPPAAACLVMGLHEASAGRPQPTRLLELWSAARQLIVAGSMQRDAMLSATR